jgi:hypothetical protein
VPFKRTPFKRIYTLEARFSCQAKKPKEALEVLQEWIVQVDFTGLISQTLQVGYIFNYYTFLSFLLGLDM